MPTDAASPMNRDELFADRSLVGTVFCRAYARRVDEWLQQLFEAHIGTAPGISLVAVGGYGRSTLSPQSDLDVMLLHSGWPEADLTEAAEALWFPVWDAHISLGHSVRTVHQSIELAESDLDTATSLLNLRHLAGDPELSDDLAEQSARSWNKNRRKWLPILVDDARNRERLNGEVAYLLEPDLKSSSGGLRDVNAVDWIQAGGIDLLDQEVRDLKAANEVLLAARVELHRSTQRKGDRLLLEEQDAVAAALGLEDADVMMSSVAASARTITWIADDVFLRVNNGLRRFKLRGSKARKIDDCIMFADGRVSLSPEAKVGADAALLLRLAVAAAEKEARIDRDSLDSVLEFGPKIPTPWTAEVRELFVRLLLTGHDAIHVIETLDHVGLLVRLLPEWEPTRSKVQRNQYHRFTVDRHLLEASAIAAGLVDRVERPDLLVVGALLHDIGKGYPGDHTDVGVDLIDTIATYMGFDIDDVDVLKRMCEHHLLLPDVATRRDIEDIDTISSVARQVETPEFLHLLACLTEADSIATGPSAWSSWKARLTADLTRSVEHWLESGGSVAIDRSFPSEAQQQLLDDNDHVLVGEGDTLTLVTGDRIGLFSRVAGALALRSLNILGAQVHAQAGKALEVYRVVDARDETEPIDWAAAIASIEECLASADDLRPKFAARTAAQLVKPKDAPSPIVPIRVDFDNNASSDATVIEVAGPDHLGLLYEVSSTLAAAALDIQRAHIQTVGGDVVDAFYVHTVDGLKLTDEALQSELRSSLLRILRDGADYTG